MSTLHIIEYSGHDGDVPFEPAIGEQMIEIGPEWRTTQLSGSTRYFEVWADGPCMIRFDERGPQIDLAQGEIVRRGKNSPPLVISVIAHETPASDDLKIDLHSLIAVAGDPAVASERLKQFEALLLKNETALQALLNVRAEHEARATDLEHRKGLIEAAEGMLTERTAKLNQGEAALEQGQEALRLERAVFERAITTGRAELAAASDAQARRIATENKAIKLQQDQIAMREQALAEREAALKEGEARQLAREQALNERAERMRLAAAG